MKRYLLSGFALMALVLEPAPVLAQTNNNDYTPLGTRIRKSRPFPYEPRSTFQPHVVTDAQRARGRTWVDKLGKCMWNRSNEKALDLLQRTDFGFRSMQQLGLEASDIDKLYPLRTCMSQVAANAGSGMMVRYSASGLRSLYLQAAYFDSYKAAPTWIKPGYVIAERDYPLSQADESVQAAMDLADCVVAEDPQGADYFYRTAESSAEEKAAIQNLLQPLSECIPAGAEVQLDRSAFRLWIGEGLWHAANNSVPLAEQPGPVDAPAEQEGGE